MLDSRSIAVQGIGFGTLHTALQGFAELALVIGGEETVRSLHYTRVRKATADTIRAFLRWFKELELAKAKEKKLRQALKQLATAEPEDVEAGWFARNLNMMRVILIQAAVEATFEEKRRIQVLMEAVEKRVQALAEEARVDEEMLNILLDDEWI